jgi:hypothetical protein
MFQRLATAHCVGIEKENTVAGGRAKPEVVGAPKAKIFTGLEEAHSRMLVRDPLRQSIAG